MREAAEYFGLSDEELRRAIEAWSAETRRTSDDPRERALAEFGERHYLEAADLFLESARRRDAEAVRDYQLAGDAFHNALDFARAHEMYESALARAGAECEPEIRRVLRGKRANAARELATRSPVDVSELFLESRINDFRKLLESYSRETRPQDWAMTRNDLGIALKEQGIRTDGAAGAGLLAEAVEAYRAALKVRTR